ncbi:hypothetical protein RB595_008933 [Gaeumannomyces hyphopodioides]
MAEKDVTPAAAAPAPAASGMPVADTNAGLQAVIGGPEKSAEAAVPDVEKQVPVDATQNTAADDDINQKPGPDDSSDFRQDGVARVQAVTSVWTSKTMWSMFAMLYVVSFVDSLTGNVQGALSPYVTSSFGQHGLLGTTSIVSSLLGGIAPLTVAKLINVWGRLEGLIIMVLLSVVGLVMKAVCQNVETYAAAQTLYWVGHIGLLFIINVTLADMTTLKNRMIVLGFNTSPMIISYAAGPVIAERFINESSFRWAFGAFSIILVGVTVPVALVFIANERKAKAAGILAAEPSGRSWVEACRYYWVQFDVVGLVLITVGWALLLLPFSLTTHVGGGWANGSLIAMLVMGPAILAAFVAWEYWWTPVPFFPWKYLRDRTVLGSCMVYGFMFVSIFCWDTYYFSYLQVAHFQDITGAGYILNAFSLTSAALGVFIGVGIRWTGNVKWTAAVGVPFLVLGTGLLARFRNPDSSIGVLVMLQVFNGVGSGLLALCGQLAVMASVGHNEIAVGLALHGLFGGIGAAVGQAIAGGLWNNVLPYKLAELLPDEAKADAATIFGDMVNQMAQGGAVRDAIIAAYGHVQHLMVIAGCAFVPLVVGSLLLWKNINVRELEAVKGTQTKGRVW